MGAGWGGRRGGAGAQEAGRDERPRGVIGLGPSQRGLNVAASKGGREGIGRVGTRAPRTRKLQVVGSVQELIAEPTKKRVAADCTGRVIKADMEDGTGEPEEGNGGDEGSGGLHLLLSRVSLVAAVLLGCHLFESSPNAAP